MVKHLPMIPRDRARISFGDGQALADRLETPVVGDSEVQMSPLVVKGLRLLRFFIFACANGWVQTRLLQF